MDSFVAEEDAQHSPYRMLRDVPGVHQDNAPEPRQRTLGQVMGLSGYKRLDEAVFAAYGWKSDMSDEEILEKLLALNLERAKA